LFKSLKRLKLKKLKPGIIIKRAVGAAAAVGIPGAGTLNKGVDRIGKRVDQANVAIARAKAAIQKERRDTGASVGDAADRVAERALAGAAGGVTVGGNMPIILFGVAALVIFFVMRKR
jgi:hypothetical protein